MAVSAYVSNLRARVGHDLLLLPGVTAVIRNGDRFLLARQLESARWGTIGGAIDPGEEPAAAVAREVLEEIGVAPAVGRMIGAYGGDDFIVEYPNGDRVSYISVAYECHLPDDARFSFADGELVEVGWFTRTELAVLSRDPWVDRILDDALAADGSA
ncbi:NADH pyrophosphatase [Microbacterium hydrocarbonoxydans]|uniref:NADH pyrophosphatase n=1 Tax=Microbacterium hydrocarbonoxydans TaxID=273678 RepID=A0A0M2HP71_9MICO|nr:NUDIX domain-containing protein [Microbacterium hydrocarbonoxydans]KJL46718.1 NADH pyrophosphatase [Microbacterium hydrocarbonoxydans]